MAHHPNAPKRRGGRVKAPTAAPLAARVAGLDLTTGRGLAAFVAAALGALGGLPFDCRTANAISQMVTCARGVVETAQLEARIAALEQARMAGPERVA